MNPIQHGEIFVTEDGTETDLDLGHYERLLMKIWIKIQHLPPVDILVCITKGASW